MKQGSILCNAFESFFFLKSPIPYCRNVLRRNACVLDVYDLLSILGLKRPRLWLVSLSPSLTLAKMIWTFQKLATETLYSFLYS